jgi:hypothetical protein
MLLASALHRLLSVYASVYANGSLRYPAAGVIKADVPIVVVQLLSRVLCGQQDNASWEDTVEINSHGALLVWYAFKLPCPLSITQHAKTAFFKANTYLAAHFDERATGDYYWIEKVTYKLPTLAACCLAALNSPVKGQSWTSEVEQIFKTHNTKGKDGSGTAVKNWLITLVDTYDNR